VSRGRNKLQKVVNRALINCSTRRGLTQMATLYTGSRISVVLRPTVRRWEGDRIELKSDLRPVFQFDVAKTASFSGSSVITNYPIYKVGGRIAPQQRIPFLREFDIAAQVPDDHIAHSAKPTPSKRSPKQRTKKTKRRIRTNSCAQAQKQLRARLQVTMLN
jgi:hypothetical protein